MLDTPNGYVLPYHSGHSVRGDIHLEYEPNFRIDINCQVSYREFLRWFEHEWVDLGIEWPPSGPGITPQNFIIIGENPDYNPAESAKYGGWFYYPYFVEAALRIKQDVTNEAIEKQIELARLLKTRLEEKGCDVKVHAGFEKLL